MALCRHAKTTGIVTNQDPHKPLDNHRAHASTTTCERPACMAGSMRWVAGETNETAAYYTFAEIRAARSAS